MKMIGMSKGGLALMLVLVGGLPGGVVVAQRAMAQRAVSQYHAAHYGSKKSSSPRTRQVAIPLTATQIVGAFQAHGLPVDNLHQEPAYSPPGGPPLDATAVWRFAIPEVAPSGAKIMTFATTAARDQMVSWFQMVGTRYVVVHNNTILWLDPRLTSTRVAAYQQALSGL